MDPVFVYILVSFTNILLPIERKAITAPRMQ